MKDPEVSFIWTFRFAQSDKELDRFTSLTMTKKLDFKIKLCYNELNKINNNKIMAITTNFAFDVVTLLRVHAFKLTLDAIDLFSLTANAPEDTVGIPGYPGSCVVGPNYFLDGSIFSTTLPSFTVTDVSTKIITITACIFVDAPLVISDAGLHPVIGNALTTSGAPDDDALIVGSSAGNAAATTNVPDTSVIGSASAEVTWSWTFKSLTTVNKGAVALTGVIG